MTYRVRHKLTHELLSGDIGTNTGKQIAEYLKAIDRLDVLDEFYDWVDATPGDRVKRLYNWLSENKRDLFNTFMAREKIMGREVREWL